MLIWAMVHLISALGVIALSDRALSEDASL